MDQAASRDIVLEAMLLSGIYDETLEQETHHHDPVLDQAILEGNYDHEIRRDIQDYLQGTFLDLFNDPSTIHYLEGNQQGESMEGSSEEQPSTSKALAAEPVTQWAVDDGLQDRNAEGQPQTNASIPPTSASIPTTQRTSPRNGEEQPLTNDASIPVGRRGRKRMHDDTDGCGK